MYLSYLSVNCRYVYWLYLKWSFIDFLNIFTVWVNKIWICLHKSCTDCKCQKEKSCETEMLLWHERFNSLALSQSSWYYKVLLSFSLTLYCPPLEHKNIHIHLSTNILDGCLILFITRHAVNRVKPCIYIDNLNCARNKQGIQGQSILDPSPVLDLELWILYSGLSNFEILSALIIIIIIYVLTTKMIRCEPLSHSVYFWIDFPFSLLGHDFL